MRLFLWASRFTRVCAALQQLQKSQLQIDLLEHY